MQPERNNSFSWLIWGIVTIAVAAIGVIGTNPDLLCRVLPETCSTSDTPDISGNYLMDNIPERVVFIERQSDNIYAIGEDTSPWPWHGTITLAGNNFSGSGRFPASGTNITIEGHVSSDGRISIEYQFVGETRVDRHWLYPRFS